MGEIVFLKDGTARFVYSDAIAGFMRDVGKLRTARASNVEPMNDGWAVDLSPVGGPILGPYATREEALRAEVDWLRTHGLPLPTSLRS